MQKTEDWMKQRWSALHAKPVPTAHLLSALNTLARFVGTSVVLVSAYSATYVHIDLSALLISRGHIRLRRTNIIIIWRPVGSCVVLHPNVYFGIQCMGQRFLESWAWRNLCSLHFISARGTMINTMISISSPLVSGAVKGFAKKSTILVLN